MARVEGRSCCSKVAKGKRRVLHDKGIPAQNTKGRMLTVQSQLRRHERHGYCPCTGLGLRERGRQQGLTDLTAAFVVDEFSEGNRGVPVGPPAAETLDLPHQLLQLAFDVHEADAPANTSRVLHGQSHKF